MKTTLINKIISYSLLLCVFLNASLSCVILDRSFDLDLSAATSSIAGTITYSYNLFQFTKDLQDTLLTHLYKTSDKQSKKNDEKKPAEDKKGDFITAPVLYYNVKTVRQNNNIFYGKTPAKAAAAMPANNLYGEFWRNAALFAFYFMLMMWLAIIFRKRWNFNYINVYRKNIYPAV